MLRRTPPLRVIARDLATRTTPTQRMAALLLLVSAWAAVVAARVGGTDQWLYQLDIPKIDLPLAVFFHEALMHGALPLWNDRLGLGFPLYAEGQIGAFYLPNWLIFRLDPLVALDVSRALHLVLAGVGTGLIVLRTSGSRPGSAVAAATAVLCGGIVTKLEWTNLVAAYGWAPWVLLPLVRRPGIHAVALSGAAWGVQALCGHPNTWVFTGLAAVITLFANEPRAVTFVRAVVFGAMGLAVGAVQLIPLLLLTSLSARSEGLSPDDLFSSAMKPFDPLGFAFAGTFLRTGQDGSWDLYTNWYPNGTFALLESWAYVGLPILMLAAIGWTARRGRASRALVLAMLAIPLVAAFRPEVWTKIPLVNGMRSPTRAYLFVDLALAVLAGLAFVRLRRVASPRTALVVGGAFLAIYAVITLVAVTLPATFEGLLLDFSVRTNLQPSGAPATRGLAVAALARVWPVALELVLAAAFSGALWWLHRTRRRAAWPLAALAVIPLILFTPPANSVRAAREFTFAGNDLHPTLLALAPRRVLTIDEPGWYPGMPDQLAAAGIPDVRMFSSLDLAASDALLERLRRDPGAVGLRRLVGIDTIVTFKQPCAGDLRARIRSDDAFICHVDALVPPYWIPSAAAQMTSTSDVAWRPAEATIDVAAALRDAAPFSTSLERGSTDLTFRVDAPSDGWVFIDRAWWPAWSVSVDGRGMRPVRALGGQLIPVGAGSHTIVQRLVPLESLVGAFAGLAAIATLAATWLRRERWRERLRRRWSRAVRG